MQIADTPAAFAALPATGVTIGNFDGVHLGHQALVRRTLEVCGARGLDCVVVTFRPHPRTVLTPERPHAPLSTRAERFALLERLGVRHILELPFTRELAALSPEDFVRGYLLPLQPRELVVGHDFTLGRGRSGHPELLQQLGRDMGFGVEQVSAVLAGGAPVSSTRLRECLAGGDVALARHLLGRPYAVSGAVAHGEGRGRGLGFPTANLDGAATLLPANGVYATRARLGGRSFDAVTNIGMKPTFGGDRLTVESFLLDAEGDFYGEDLALEFAARLRGEQRFPDAAALGRQISADVALARRLLAEDAEHPEPA
ncbi:MAG: bifunctional riboflavin kinase/FAD synthetase [Desulfovibrio sp.]|uniref:bifunctional riboflavin kinase/FAD synthetase n=1 Tax=Desulfovibrio sp. TaxID=885 RepID=UPI001A7A4CD7|nr:bifunctional riboflavin kinase/FAD synthetase [Desulfovibrio sp.]MBD5417430.1 bifunctional riboflavin kinase/FAD synthetase [Desulfovibrio sp.]